MADRRWAVADDVDAVFLSFRGVPGVVTVESEDAAELAVEVLGLASVQRHAEVDELVAELVGLWPVERIQWLMGKLLVERPDVLQVSGGGGDG